MATQDTATSPDQSSAFCPYFQQVMAPLNSVLWQTTSEKKSGISKELHNYSDMYPLV